VPIESPPDEARVRVVAEGRVLARMRLAGFGRDDLYAVLRVPRDQDRVEIDLGAADVVVPLGLGLRVVEVISPTRVALLLDDWVQRDLPVVARLRGNLPQSYVLSGEPILEPRTVLVSGPEAVVAEATEVHTTPIDLGGRKRPFSEPVSLVLDPRMQANPETIHLSVDIEPTDQLALEGVPVVLRNRTRQLATFEPRVGSVTILGPKSQLKALKDIHLAGEATGIVISLDATGLGPGSHMVNPVVELSDHLRLVSIEPSEFTLTVARR